MSEQALVLLCKKLLTESLLDECPILVDSVVLLCKLRIGLTLSLILGEELLKSVYVETTCLLVVERSLHKHRVGSLGQYILQLSVGYGKAELLSLVSDELGLNVCVPNHILNLVELVFVEVVLTLLHLNNLCVLINEFLKLCNVDFLTQYFSDLLSCIIA